MVQSTSIVTLYVNPATGNDAAAGTLQAPFKTLTRSLQQAQDGTTIQLAPGTYNSATGEAFPLAIPAGVTVLGNEASMGSGILIEGSGAFLSPTFAYQNVTFQLENNAQLRGVTVTNRAVRGTAVWVESTAPTIAKNTFTNCNREGVFATGNASPLILDNVFVQNSANGISIVRNTKGEVRGNVCQQTGFGMAIGDNAAPLVVDNKIFENRSGIVLSDAARPVLRQNLIEKNTSIGLVVISNALPDLGSSQDPGGNVIRDNGEFDLQNATSVKLVAVGNQLDPTRVNGLVDLVDNQLPPTPTPTPPTPTPTPTPPIPTPTPPTPTPIPTPTQFTDITGHWAEQFIQGLATKGLVSGFPNGTFRPNVFMTRAQYAALLVKAFNPAPKRAASNFSDVSADFWGAAAIAQAYRGGFLSGFPNNTFRPNQNVLRVQVIVSLVQGLGLPPGDEKILSVYDDRNSIPSYAPDLVATATQRRIVINYPSLKQLNPNRDATRAEVAAMVYQALANAGQASALTSPYIVSA